MYIRRNSHLSIGPRLYSYFVHQDPYFTLVDGNWSSWGVYGDCTVKCGGGVRRRSRSCTNPKPSNGGRSCRGSSTQTVTCNMDIPCDGKKVFSKIHQVYQNI